MTDREKESTFAIGIDLGTTHCALAYVDRDLSEGEDVALHLHRIPQTVSPGETEKLPLLPSFVYLPHARELAAGATALPWNPTPAWVVGEIARRLGAGSPQRLVASAKSWLSHGAVDRTGPILPTTAPEDVQRISPVDASVRYLEHLREAWNAANSGEPLADQEVVLTVPASFDPAARELTAEAARRAGFANLTLLEEPQAALYSWIEATHGAWRERLSVGDVILVVDVGGGTTDLSLIAVLEEEGILALHRIAVGDHILLGGDNMDLALAFVVKSKIEANGERLDDWQVEALRHACRAAKEALLSGEVETAPIVVASRGSKLVGKSLRSELTAEEVSRVLLDGFFPEVDVEAKPHARARTALTQVGLPYAQDPAITRHLAAFLTRQLAATADLEGFEVSKGRFLHPTALLFNGGVLKAPAIAERVRSVLDGWLVADGAKPVQVLEDADLDGAVARGAAYYAFARSGGGVRIRGGMAQAFYVGVEVAMMAVPGMEPPVHALCVAPFGLDEGSALEAVPQQLGLVVGEPVRFRFFSSSVRRDDPVGTVLERWSPDELSELGAIEANLPASNGDIGGVVPVHLRARVTELGTLVLEALPEAGGEPYRVELDVRTS